MQSTILVKKKDGSQVRMTMEEFRDYKNSVASDDVVPADDLVSASVPEPEVEPVFDNSTIDNEVPYKYDVVKYDSKGIVFEEKEVEPENELNTKYEQDTELHLPAELEGTAVIEPELDKNITESEPEIKTESEPEIESTFAPPSLLASDGYDEATADKQKFNENLTKDEIETEPEVVEDVVQPVIKPVEIESKIEPEIATPEISQPVSQSDSDLPVLATPHELSISTPVKNIFVDEAMANSFPVFPTRKKTLSTTKQWEKVDSESPLETANDEIKKMLGSNTLPDKRHDVCEQVMMSLGFSVSADLQSRLRSLIISYIKEIRNSDQITSYAMSPTESGGLGLSQDQAQELIAVINKTKATKKSSQPSQVIIPPASSIADKLENKSVSMMSTAFRSAHGSRPVMHDMKKTVSNKNIVPDIGPVVAGSVTDEFLDEKQTVSQIEEIKNIGIADFRQLSDDPAYAAKRLLQQIEDLKEDNYSLYVQGVRAWYQSPLYSEYQSIIRKTVDLGKTIDEVFSAGNNNITRDEFISILEAQRHLNI